MAPGKHPFPTAEEITLSYEAPAGLKQVTTSCFVRGKTFLWSQKDFFSTPDVKIICKTGPSSSSIINISLLRCFN